MLKEGSKIQIYVPDRGWVPCEVYKHATTGELVVVGKEMLLPASLVDGTPIAYVTDHSSISAAGRPNVPGYGA